MREFYIFSINQIYINIIKKQPYALFNKFNKIYNIDRKNIKNNISLYKSIVKPFNKDILNNKLYNEFKDDDHYTKFMYTHIYNNYYSRENTKLILYNSYMIITSSYIKPIFFDYLKKYKCLFVCDFENLDYFWLDSIA